MFDPMQLSNFFAQFNQFRQNFQQTGEDPRQKVQELLNSGKMTQEQFNFFRMMANKITGKRM